MSNFEIVSCIFVFTFVAFVVGNDFDKLHTLLNWRYEDYKVA